MKHGIKPSREQRKFIENAVITLLNILSLKTHRMKCGFVIETVTQLLNQKRKKESKTMSITKIKTKNHAELLELRSHYIGGSDVAVQDKTIKNEIKKDMYEVQNETVSTLNM